MVSPVVVVVVVVVVAAAVSSYSFYKYCSVDDYLVVYYMRTSRFLHIL